jgi:hypothetical protein
VVVLHVEDYQEPAGDWSRSVAKERTQEEMTQDEPMREDSCTILMQDAPIQVEMIIFDAPLGGYDTNIEVEDSQWGIMVRGEASAPVSLRDIYMDLVVCSPGPAQPRDQALGDAVLAPGSSSVVDPGIVELGLPSYPHVQPPPVSWK